MTAPADLAALEAVLHLADRDLAELDPRGRADIAFLADGIVSGLHGSLRIIDPGEGTPEEARDFIVGLVLTHLCRQWCATRLAHLHAKSARMN